MRRRSIDILHQILFRNSGCASGVDTQTRRYFQMLKLLMYHPQVGSNPATAYPNSLSPFPVNGDFGKNIASPVERLGKITAKPTFSGSPGTETEGET
jgi:hypothetical protein